MTLINKNNGFAQFFILIGLFFLGVGFSLVATFLIANNYGVAITDLPVMIKTKNPALLPVMKWLLVSQFVFMFMVPSILFGLLMHKKTFWFLGFKAPKVNWHWAVGIVLLLVAIPFVGLLGKFNESITPAFLKSASQDYKDQMDFLITDMRQTKSIVFMLFCTGLLAGLGEELFFRGCLQNLVIKYTKKPWLGIIITAVLFSAFHMEFTGFLPRFALGALLGAAYWYSGSLWVSVLGHAAFNITSVVAMYYNQDIDAVNIATSKEYIMLALGGTISLILITLVLKNLIKTSQTKFKEVYEISETPLSDFDAYFKQ
jgi:uncharacterized protein